MPKCIQLVGVPGSGKTTWIDSLNLRNNFTIISTDIHVENHAKFVGKSYSEVFASYMPTAVNLMTFDVINARESNKDIIWDQTSTTIISRVRKFSMLPGYEHIAVVFKTPDTLELRRRLNERKDRNTPWDVVQEMIDNFQYPTRDEGFSIIL